MTEEEQAELSRERDSRSKPGASEPGSGSGLSLSSVRTTAFFFSYVFLIDV